MSTTINFEKLEEKVFTTMHKDGLLDVFIGIVLLQFVVGPLLTDIGFSDFEASSAFIPVWLITFIAYFLIKRFVTKPRIGNIKPGFKRKSKMIKVNIILTLILFTGFLTGLLYEQFADSIRMQFPLMISMLILAVASVTAYYLDITRFYYYGLLIALGPIIGEMLWNNGMVSHHGYPLVFGILSIVLISIGIIQFFRFIQAYPVVNIEE